MSKRKARAGAPRPPLKMRGALTFVHPGGDGGVVKASFMSSAIRTMMYEAVGVGIPMSMIDMQCASGQLVEARNDAVKYFLEKDSTDWMWMVDSDMGFGPDTFSQLVASADPDARPVMGALCFGLRLKGTDDSTYANTFAAYPTIYTWRETDDNVGFEAQLDYPRDSVVQCDATGAACFIAHRTVLEKIRDELGHVWFNRLVHPSGKMFGEDLSFFARCAQVGAPVHVNTAVKTMHDKGGVCIDEAWWDANRAVAAPNA